MIQVWVCICANSPIIIRESSRCDTWSPGLLYRSPYSLYLPDEIIFELFCALNSLRFSPFLAQNMNFSYLHYEHQWNMLRSCKKLNFYSTFKTDVSRSEYLDLIKNEKHCQAVAKLRSSNHKIRIETDSFHIPKIPEKRRICQFC